MMMEPQTLPEGFQAYTKLFMPRLNKHMLLMLLKMMKRRMKMKMKKKHLFDYRISLY
jgi:hypothetical protein